MNRKNYWISIVLLVILLSITSCSGSRAECKVKVNKGEFPQIIVNPPGETGEAEFSCEVSKNTSISSGKSSTKYTGTCTQIYQESGNTYNIRVFIAVANDRLESYFLDVTGGVYGSEGHICEFP